MTARTLSYLKGQWLHTIAPLAETPEQDLIDSVQFLAGDGIPQILKEWAEAGAYELLSITYDVTTTDVIASSTVKWPDGSLGTFTTTSINTTWHQIDAYTITHTNSGATVTQAAVTRNASGLITTKPSLTVA